MSRSKVVALREQKPHSADVAGEANGLIVQASSVAFMLEMAMCRPEGQRDDMQDHVLHVAKAIQSLLDQAWERTCTIEDGGTR